MSHLRINLHRELFNEVYLPYVATTTPIEVYYGGSGSGKSHFIAQKVIYKSLTTKRKVLIVRKTLVSQRESCWRLVLQVLSDWKLSQLCNVNKTDMTIEFPNHSVMLFKGLDDSEKIKSITGITDCWIEEATELTQEDYDLLRLRVRADVPNSQFFLSFNPVSRANWCYRRFFDEETRDLTDTSVLKTTHQDNRFLPLSYITTLETLAKTNNTYYRIYALGEFCSLDKLVFSNWSIGTLPIEGLMLVGMDFGFSTDLTTIVSSYVDELNKTIYVHRVWGDTNKTNPEIASVLQNMGLSKSTIIADCAEPKSIEELKRANITRIRPSVKGPDSIIHGIQKLQQYQIVVNPCCEGLITELENYSWKKDKKTGEYVNEPIDQFNHYIDALRYSLQCVSNRITVMDKSILGL